MSAGSDSDELQAPKKGPRWYREDLAKRDKVIKRNKPLKGHGISVDAKPDGTKINQNKGTDGGSGTIGQLQVVDASDNTGTKIRITFGHVAGAPPTNLPTDGLVLSLSGETKVWCAVARDADTGVMTTGAITTGVSFPAETETSGVGQIASPSFSGGALTPGQITSGTLYADYCGMWRWNT